MNKDEFIEEVFEIAFGDSVFHNEGDLVRRGFSYHEVINQLKEFSDNALKYEENNG